MKPPPVLKTLDFNIIRERLDALSIAVPNFLEHERNPKLDAASGLREFLFHQLSGAVWLHKLVRFACAEKPSDPLRHPELVAAIFPTIRSQLDLVFVLLFIFDDFPARFVWYQKAGWFRAMRAYVRDVARHGSDPNFAEILRSQASFLRLLEQEVPIRPEEIAAPKRLIKPWPNPGRFHDYLNDPSLAAVFEKLDELLYDELSGSAHFTMLGTLAVGQVISNLKRSTGDDWELWVRTYRSYAFSQSTALILAALSEIEVQFRFGAAPDLLFVWSVCSDTFPLIKEVFESRWKQGLAPE